MTTLINILAVIGGLSIGVSIVGFVVVWLWAPEIEDEEQRF